MKCTFPVITLLALANAAPKSPKFQKLSPRIIGGNLAEPHSIPYQVLLEVWAKRGGWYCGGALISQSYVLTSAQCATAYKYVPTDVAFEVLVTLGAHNMYITESTQVNLYSKEIIVYPDYELGGFVNDIALIKLPEPVVFTDAIQPVALPKRGDANLDYAEMVGKISGWGSDDGFDPYTFDVLRYTYVKVVNNNKKTCSYLAIKLPSTMLCTEGVYEGQYVGPCNNDAGGPLVVNGTVIGVFSFGMAYCLEGESSAYTRVDKFLDWIEASTDIVIN